MFLNSTTVKNPELHQYHGILLELWQEVKLRQFQSISETTFASTTPPWATWFHSFLAALGWPQGGGGETRVDVTAIQDSLGTAVIKSVSRVSFYFKMVTHPGRFWLMTGNGLGKQRFAQQKDPTMSEGRDLVVQTKR